MMSLSFLYWLNPQAARCYPPASTETNLISANRELYAIFQSVCQIIWRYFCYWNGMANGNRLTGLSSLKVTIFPSDSFSFNCPSLKNIIKDSKQLRRRYYFQKLKNLSWESICACSFFSCWQILNYLANFLMQNFCLLSKLLHLTWEGFFPNRSDAKKYFSWWKKYNLSAICKFSLMVSILADLVLVLFCCCCTLEYFTAIVSL